MRRIFEALEYEVSQLERLAFAGLTASGLKRGEWRKLNQKEVEYLSALGGGGKVGSKGHSVSE